MFVDDVQMEFAFIALCQDLGTKGQEAGGDEPLIADSRVGVIVGEEVARELFAEELVDWLVGVEGVDDVVAVTPGVAVGDVFVESVGIGVADHVEPVSSPAFAVVG